MPRSSEAMHAAQEMRDCYFPFADMYVRSHIVSAGMSLDREMDAELKMPFFTLKKNPD